MRSVVWWQVCGFALGISIRVFVWSAANTYLLVPKQLVYLYKSVDGEESVVSV